MAVECSGNFAGGDETIEGALGIGGKVAIVGMDARPAELDFIDHQLKAASVYGIVGHSRLLGLPQRDRADGLRARSTCSTRSRVDIPLESLVDAIEETKNRGDGKVLVKPVV